MANWEYCRVAQREDEDKAFVLFFTDESEEEHPTWAQALAQLGRAGWEAVSVITYQEVDDSEDDEEEEQDYEGDDMARSLAILQSISPPTYVTVFECLLKRSTN